jgi:hypothetical protein
MSVKFGDEAPGGDDDRSMDVTRGGVWQLLAVARGEVEWKPTVAIVGASGRPIEV